MPLETTDGFEWGVTPTSPPNSVLEKIKQDAQKMAAGWTLWQAALESAIIANPAQQAAGVYIPPPSQLLEAAPTLEGIPFSGDSDIDKATSVLKAARKNEPLIYTALRDIAWSRQGVHDALFAETVGEEVPGTSSSMAVPQIRFFAEYNNSCSIITFPGDSYVPLYMPFVRGGSYGQGMIEIPAQLLGLDGDGVVLVDIFVPSHPGGEWLLDPNSPVITINDSAWQTIQYTTPSPRDILGSGNVSQQIGLLSANTLWGSDQSRLVIPANYMEETGFTFWDRERFIQWQHNQHRVATFQGTSPDQFINPSNFDSVSYSSVLPSTGQFQFTRVPAPRGNSNTPSLLAEAWAVNDNSGAFVPFSVATIIDYFNTTAPGLGIQDAQRDKDRQIRDFVPYRDTIMVGVEVQQRTEEDETDYRAIVYGWQYFTVAEPDFSDSGSWDFGFVRFGHDSTSSARMMDMGVGSYIGAQGIYPVHINDLTGEDNWRGGSSVSSVQYLIAEDDWPRFLSPQFSYWNQEP